MIVLRPGVPKLRIDELAFSPDGSAVAAPAGARGLLLWSNITRASKSDVLTPPVRVVSRIAFAPDGRTLYAGKDQLCAFDLASHEGARLEIPSWAALHFGVSPDSTRLCVAENPQNTEHTRITCWDTTALGAPSHEVVTPSLVYSPPLFAPDGGSFVLVEGFHLPSRLWEFRRVTRSSRTGAVLEQSAPLPGYPEQTVRSPDGRTLACRTYDVISFYPAEGP